MVKETRFYDLLEVQPNSDVNVIKMSFHKLARGYHPDKNPEAGEKFKDISMAYAVLSDPVKRQVYDMYGEEGIKTGRCGTFPTPKDPYQSWFGNDAGMGGQSRRTPKGAAQQNWAPRTTKNITHFLSITLEQIYNGHTNSLTLNKNVICKGCNGKGSHKAAELRCPNCHGTGFKVQRLQNKVSSMCLTCNKLGEWVHQRLTCGTCEGRKVTKEHKVFEVAIDKGMEPNGQKITFKNGAHQEPGLGTGDVIIVLNEKKHAVFERRGMDLITQFEISFSEAFCGFKRTIETLDKRILVIETNPGEVIKDGDVKYVLDEGMPTYRNPTEKGKLIIYFKVDFPERIATEVVDKLKTIFPCKNEPIIPEEHKKVNMNDYGNPEREFQNQGEPKCKRQRQH